MAELTVYPEAGDGEINCSRGATTWNSVHDETGTTNVAANYTAPSSNCAISRRHTATQFTINRGFFPFDTSAMGVGATVSSAILTLFVTAWIDSDNDGDDWINVVQTTQVGSATLVAEDYDQCGAINDPTEGATRIDITGKTDNTTQDWTLNATGRGWIIVDGVTFLGMREGHDALDNEVTVTGQTGINVRYSEYSGTSSDPKLVIVFSTGIDYTMVAETGSFALTGNDVGLAKGYTIVAETGSYILTGFSVNLRQAMNLVAETGSYILTGISTVLTLVTKLVAQTGSFILTGYDVRFGGAGSWKVTNQSKSTPISPINQSQNNISPTGQSKSSTVTFKNQEKS